MFKIVPKNKKKNKQKLTIKGEMSSSSDDERFEKFHYAQKVQNIQNRDNHNELINMFFQRTQSKNPKAKSKLSYCILSTLMILVV
jgi:hypothetical protein